MGSIGSVDEWAGRVCLYNIHMLHVHTKKQKSDLELQEIEPHEAPAHSGGDDGAHGGVGDDGEEELGVDPEEDGGEGLYAGGGGGGRGCVRVWTD